jgi:hypothetical protein
MQTWSYMKYENAVCWKYTQSNIILIYKKRTNWRNLYIKFKWKQTNINNMLCLVLIEQF